MARAFAARGMLFPEHRRYATEAPTMAGTQPGAPTHDGPGAQPGQPPHKPRRHPVVLAQQAQLASDIQIYRLTTELHNRLGDNPPTSSPSRAGSASSGELAADKPARLAAASARR